MLSIVIPTSMPTRSRYTPIASRIEVVTVHLLPCLAAAIAMYREMGMSFWPERARAEMADPAPPAA